MSISTQLVLHLGEAALVAVAAEAVRRLVRSRARTGVRARVGDVGTCGLGLRLGLGSMRAP